MMTNFGEQDKMRGMRWSLAHIALNNFFYIWSFGGSIFLLFLSEMGLPKDQIGFLLSLFPFAGLVAIGLGPSVARWGRKRVYVTVFGFRKPVMGLLMLLPWILTEGGKPLAVAFLYAVILSVAILRAVAETAYYPWMQEFVPNAVRGKFGSVSTILLMVTSLIAVAIASQVVERTTLLYAFTRLLAVGVVIGVIGVAVMVFVPGGAPIPTANVKTRAYLSSLKDTFKDRDYTFFLGGMGCYTMGIFMLSSFLPLYLKEQFNIQLGSIVFLDTASMVGGAAASILSGVLADRLGSRPVLLPSLVATIFVPVGWLLAPALQTNMTAASAVLYFILGAFSVSASISASRLLFNRVIPVEKNTEYTSIYYAWAGLTGGIGPLLGGRLLSGLADWQIGSGLFSLDAFRLLFVFSLVGFIGSALLYARVQPDNGING